MQGDSGQLATPLQSAQLLFCCKQIERRYGNKQVGEWTNRDYIYLSHTISRDTSILISPNTLKRIFGKIHTTAHYFPQQATRDALAKFAGFANWAAMSEQMPEPVIGTEAAIGTVPGVRQPDEISREQLAATKEFPDTIESSSSRTAFWWAYRKWIGGFAAVILLVLISLYLQKTRDDLVLPGTVRLVCQNPEGANPHTALFKLEAVTGELPHNGGFTIDFNDRKSKRSIQSGELLNHYFEMPGVYYPILYYNDKPIDTSRVSLLTTEWSATASMLQDTTRVYPIGSANIWRDGKLQVTTPTLFAAGIDTNKTFLVNFYQTTSEDISGDDFTLNIKLRTSSDRPGVRCSQVWTKVFGDHYYHDVLLLKPGCTNWSTIGFSENRAYGGSSDLRALGVDLSGGGEIRLQVKNRQAEVYVNGNLIYTGSYTKSIGNIQGIGIDFSGIGTIEKVELSDRRQTGVRTLF
jgi:hypothetical protein